MDLSYGPFVAKYSGFVLNGCPVDQTRIDTARYCDRDSGLVRFDRDLTGEERTRMQSFRNKWMTYSYCYDKKRYSVPLPECVFNSEELKHLQKFDRWTFGSGN